MVKFCQVQFHKMKMLKLAVHCHIFCHDSRDADWEIFHHDLMHFLNIEQTCLFWSLDWPWKDLWVLHKSGFLTISHRVIMHQNKIIMNMIYKRTYVNFMNRLRRVWRSQLHYRQTAIKIWKLERYAKEIITIALL